MNTTKVQLTRRQEGILTFIRESIQSRGFPPSIREIGEAVGLSSSSTVHSHLRALERRGYLKRNPSKPRSIQLVEGPNFRSRVTCLEELLREARQFVGCLNDNGKRWHEKADALGVGPAVNGVAEELVLADA